MNNYVTGLPTESPHRAGVRTYLHLNLHELILHKSRSIQCSLQEKVVYVAKETLMKQNGKDAEIAQNSNSILIT